MVKMLNEIHNHGGSYFGLLVEVGSVFGEDLSYSYFVLLSCQMEGSQTALHTQGAHTKE